MKTSWASKRETEREEDMADCLSESSMSLWMFATALEGEGNSRDCRRQLCIIPETSRPLPRLLATLGLPAYWRSGLISERASERNDKQISC
jgi:hypothetical protein